MDPALLDGVERTLLLPLWGRATESSTPGGLLHDPASVRAAERLGLGEEHLGAPQKPISRLAWIVRALEIDRELDARTPGEGPWTVVSVGSGLDTALDRLLQRNPSLEGRLSWYDVDLPRVVALRRQLLPTLPGQVLVPASATDAAAWAGVEVRGPLLVLAVGVLYYLSADEVARVFARAMDVPRPGPISFFIDLCSAMGRDVANRDVLAGCPGARMVWSVERDEDLLALHPRLTRVESWPLFAHHRPPGALGEVAALSDRVRILSMARLQAD